MVFNIEFLENTLDFIFTPLLYQIYHHYITYIAMWLLMQLNAYSLLFIRSNPAVSFNYISKDNKIKLIFEGSYVIHINYPFHLMIALLRIRYNITAIATL